LIGQIITVYKDRYLVEYNDKKIMTEVSGRFKYLNLQKCDYPQIGDFVKFHLADEYLGIIEQVLERKNTLDRQDVGKDAAKHILAANIDICFICMSLNKEVNEGLVFGEAINNTKELVNKPYNYLNASNLADYALGFKRFPNVEVKVYNKAQIEEMKMGAFLGVNKGSLDEPRLIHVRYKGDADSKENYRQ